MDEPADGVRRAGVSAFGFGGTNFHIVLEEYIPAQADRQRKAFGGGRRDAAGCDRAACYASLPGRSRPAIPLQGAAAGSAGDRRRFGGRHWPSVCARSRKPPRRAARRPPPRRPKRICARRSAWRSTTPTPPSWRTNAPRRSRRWRRTSRRSGRRCARKASSAVMGPRPRWRSCIPARARST